MRAACQVFVDLAFQGRLRKSDELVGAEIFLFTRLLEEQGAALLDLPGYCITVPIEHPAKRTAILLKVRGVWTTLWLEQPEDDVFVLFDR